MRHRLALAALTALTALGVTSPAAHAAFGVQSFTAEARKSATPGDLDTQAGSHPFVGVTDFTLNNTLGIPDGNVKNVRVDLPAGLISNPEATPKCTDVQFPACPANTKLGTETITAGGITPPPIDVFNMVPGPGQVSDFAFDAPVFGRTDIIGGLRDTGDYGLFFTISNIPQAAGLTRSVLSFEGVPSTNIPFITLPTECGVPGSTKLTVESWQGDTATSVTPPTEVAGCDQVPFAPSIAVTPDTTQRDKPTGMSVDLHVPQALDPDGIESSHLKDSVVTLPPGVSLNPPAASALAACTDEQFGIGTHDPVACPDSSKVGTTEIDTPVLSAPLTGSVYLGTPHADNPFRIFVLAEGFGLSVRLEGRVTPDPATGQLTATFLDTPQVPFTDFILHFNGGPNATLANPLACGAATTTSSLTPYSGQPPATPTSAYTVDSDGQGGDCQPAPFALGFTAGTQDRTSGAFSPFTVSVSRDDGQQYLARLSVQEPPGLLGMLSNVPLCGEADAAQGTCPVESQVGTSTVAAGAGPAPFRLQGPVYLTGPYSGAPFGLSIVIRALAGPFDLGTVVVRAAIHVDPADAHLVIDADPLPTILQGIPLRLRTVSVAVDRPNFIFNPTNCGPLAIGGTLTSTEGTVQQVSSPFQATGCDALPFAPKFTASTAATTGRGPVGLNVTLRQAAGESNTRSVSVVLPKQFSARLDTVQLACPQATFNANPKSCGDGSKVGTTSAVTPLLKDPLGGTVYLVNRGATLPTLEAVLEGSGITVDLSGSIVIGGTGITSTFGAVPDVPITEFKLNLPAGPHSVLSSAADLCAAPLVMPSTILSQSGRTVKQNTVVSVTGCGVAIVRTKVKGRVATVTVRVPAAGTVRLSGKGLKVAKRRTTAAGLIKMKLKLSKRGVAALKAKRRHHKKLAVRLTARFAPSKGASAGPSKATKKLVFK